MIGTARAQDFTSHGGFMGGLQTEDKLEGANPNFRLDVQLHELLTAKPDRPMVPPKPTCRETLPEAVYPRRAELVRHHAAVLSKPHIPPQRRHWSSGLIYRAIRG